MNDDAIALRVCSFCGLPLPRPWRWRRASRATAQRLTTTPTEEPGPLFCCFGCQFAASIAGDQACEAQANLTLARLALGIFLSMNVMVFTMFLWSWDLYGPPSAEAARTAIPLTQLFRYLCLILTIPVLWALGLPLVERTWRTLRSRVITTDVLLLLGIGAAFGYSAWSVYRGSGHVYFEVACMVLVFVTLGRWLEATGRLRTTAALNSLETLLPTEATLVLPGEERRVPLDTIAPGDLVRVLAGERIGVDGRVRRGVASVDEHLLTGECHPAIKDRGDMVWGGSLNLDGDLHIEVTAPAQDGALKRMIDAVYAARRAKGHYERISDRVAALFTPAIIAIAVATFAWHVVRSDFETAMLSALAVVLIACPCALGLATPMAVWSALGVAAERQVLFRSGEAIERLATVSGLCIDKTGTLSSANAELVESFWDGASCSEEDRQQVRMASLASTHPLAAALRKTLGEANLHSNESRAITWTTRPGRGVVGQVRHDDRSTANLCLGSARLLREMGIDIAPALSHAADQAAAAGCSVMWFASSGRSRAVFAFREQLRSDAAQAMSECRDARLPVRILTGDRARPAAMVAERLGVEARAELLPDEKLAAVRDAQMAWGRVAMVGDGMNDAPALAAADVGIALGCGADVTRDSADVCLLGNDLRSILWSIKLAQRTMRVIRQNLFWAFAYNAIGIALATSGRLNPLWAAAAMVVSSLLVIANSLRLAADGPASSKVAPPQGSAPVMLVEPRALVSHVAESCAL